MLSLATHSCWYAIQVRARQEIRVSEALRAKGYETFVPLYQLKKKWSDRNKICELPLFPSYTFCRFDPQIKFSIISTPGVTRIVGFGTKPIPVEDSEIESLKIVSDSGVMCLPHPFFKAGERVEVVEGPLAGVKGVVLSVGRKSRIVISVELVHSSAVVEVDQWSIALRKNTQLQLLHVS
jgi:transcriptional antiterminator RfaH